MNPQKFSDRPQKILRITIGLIVICWMVEIVNALFGKGSIYNIIDPNLRITENLPKAAIFILTIGVASFTIALLLLRLGGETLSDLGFHKERLGRQLIRGAISGLVIFLLITFLVNPITEAFFPKAPSDSIKTLFSTSINIILLFFLSVFKGGFLEEFFRIFSLTRFEKAFQRPGLIFAIVLSSFTFGIGHLYQGTSGAIGTAVGGFFNALVFLRARSALEAVSAHTTFDLIGLVLGSLLYYGAK